MAEALASDKGELRRFILEQHPVRGFWIRLDGAWRELRSFHRYPTVVETLLGEAVTASVLLAATLKFHGTLSLQLQGDGLVRLLVAQCTHDFEIRAVARLEEQIPENASFRELVGQGRLTVTIEAGEGASNRYQGIVALDGPNLAACLESYFENSEQLPTRLALSADATRTAGVLLQKLPEPASRGEAGGAQLQDAWEALQGQVATLETPLLKLGSAEEVLPQLCGEYDCRLFAPAPVKFACRCSEERVAGLLRSLGVEELRSIIEEQGAVSVTCEFCGRPYRFDGIDVERLFADGASPEAPHSMN